MRLEKHIPGRLQLGTKCNHNCVFCSIPDDLVEEKNFEELKQMVIELKEKGTTELFITGGEPLIHPEFLRILDFVSKKGFKEIAIQTNGTKITRDLVKQIRKYPNLKFYVSFHSHNIDIFKKLSGGHNNLECVLNGLKFLNEAGIKTYVTIVINKLNLTTLKEHIKFLNLNYPFISHISLNFIDPVGRAKKNRWVVPSLKESEMHISQAVEYMTRNGLSFRLERVPLCYMDGFEHFSTETRMAVLKEKRLTYFVEPKNKKSLKIEEKKEYLKTDACKNCSVEKLCPGLNQNYAEMYGDSELYPLFQSKEQIIKRITPIEQSRLVKSEQQAETDLRLFRSAIQKKPNKNNVYDTYSFFLMHNVGIRDEPFIYTAWKQFIEKVKNGEAPNLLSLYVHFPYCTSSCSYCVYPSKKVESPNQVHNYVSYLISQMERYSPLFNKIKFKTLSIGGGTPSLMSEESLNLLLTNLFSHFKFEEKGEKSIELNPETCTLRKLQILENFGFNKVSIGVQSLSRNVLAQNNRGYQTAEKIRSTVEDFKKTKIGFLNIDLVLGLKEDTAEGFISSFEDVCRMAPSLISVYPIKTNDSYIKSNYGSISRFYEFYYPLFDKVARKVGEIALKYGFKPLEDLSKLSYVHPFSFWLKTNAFDIRYPYSNFKSEPYSNFGLGFYSESCINDMMRYITVDTKNQSTMFLKSFSSKPEDFAYSINQFLPSYDKVKFITHQSSANFAVDLNKYTQMFGSKIEEDFAYAITSLEQLGIARIVGDTLKFYVKSEKEIYPYLLFFVGRKNVINRLLK